MTAGAAMFYTGAACHGWFSGKALVVKKGIPSFARRSEEPAWFWWNWTIAAVASVGLWIGVAYSLHALFTSGAMPPVGLAAWGLGFALAAVTMVLVVRRASRRTHRPLRGDGT